MSQIGSPTGGPTQRVLDTKPTLSGMELGMLTYLSKFNSARGNCLSDFHPGLSRRSLSLAYFAFVVGSSFAMTYRGSKL
jgi:hypothetical protein